MPVIVHVVFFVLKTVEVPQLQYLTGCRCLLRAAHRWLWTSLCSCSDVFAVLDTVVDLPVASNDWLLWVDRAENCGVRSYSALTR